jgi:hypothetical protein
MNSNNVSKQQLAQLANQLKNAKKKKKNAKNRRQQSVGPSNPTSQYRLALANPFHPDAEGCKVPDLFAAHTQTFKYRLSNTVTVDASGNALVVIFPNPQYSMFAANGTLSSGGTFTYGDGTAIATPVSYGFPVPNTMRAWRIVSCGMRVTNLSSMTNAQGKFTVGTYPIDSFMKAQVFNGAAGPTVDGATMATDAAASVNVTLNAWGIPTSGTSPLLANLVEYPGAQVISALEMAEKEVDVIPRPVDPRAFEFINTDSIIGYQTINSAAVVRAGRADYTKLSGFEAAFVAVQGAVASVSTFDVEVVYHVEASVITNATTGFPTSSSANRSPTDWPGFLSAIQYATSIPAVRTGVIEGASMIHPLLGTLARSVI